MIRRSFHRGFTLAELLVSIGLFMILTTSLFGTLMIGMRIYRKNSLKSTLQLAVQNSVETMSNELRQAAPNDDPGLFGNAPTGYKIIGSDFAPAETPVEATGVIIPNLNNKVSNNSLIFNKPDYQYYKPGNPAWVPLDPRNFRKISYSVKDGNLLMREEISYNADGSIASRVEDPVAEASGGSLEFKVILVDTYGVEPNLYKLTVPYYRIIVTSVWQNDTDKDDQKTGKFLLDSVCVIPANP